MTTLGNVYIASMNLRGKRAQCPNQHAEKLNATSAQATLNKNRIAFSPMTPIEGGYKGYFNFEAYWQSGKVFENIPIEKVKNFWLNVREAKRRYPGSKGKKVLYSMFEDNKKLNYVESRKKIYAPQYQTLCLSRDICITQINHYKELLKKGNDVVIYDFDGPRSLEGEPICEMVTLDLLKEKINDTLFPFGHGYVVASMLLDIPLSTFS